MNKSNYSFETSKPAYLENIAFNKQTQCDMVYAIIKKGATNLLQISEVSGILQAVVSARISDLRKENLVDYSGQVVYQNRLRKKIVITHPQISVQGKQTDLFQ